MLQVHKKRRWKRVELGLLVDDEKPDRCVFSVEIDHTCSATLALASRRPANLAATAAATDEVSGFGVRRDEVDELLALGVRPWLGGIALEDGCLGDGATALPYSLQATRQRPREGARFLVTPNV